MSLPSATRLEGPVRTELRLERPRFDAVVVVLEGEHDVSSSARLQELLESLLARHELVVADLTEADFVDSSVMNALVQANRTASAPGSGRLVLQCSADALVYRVLEVTGILAALEWSSTRDGALRNGS